MPRGRSSRAKRVKKSIKSGSASRKTVHVIPSKGNWAVKREGTAKASKVYDSQQKAIQGAKSMTRKGTAKEVIVHRKDGTIRKHY